MPIDEIGLVLRDYRVRCLHLRIKVVWKVDRFRVGLRRLVARFGHLDLRFDVNFLHFVSDAGVLSCRRGCCLLEVAIVVYQIAPKYPFFFLFVADGLYEGPNGLDNEQLHRFVLCCVLLGDARLLVDEFVEACELGVEKRSQLAPVLVD